MRTVRRQGFTLIELLVVIGIIGLLSTLAVVALSSARQKGRDAKRVSDIKQIQGALDLYAVDRNGYPAASNLVLGSQNAACIGSAGFQQTGCTEPFMTQVPSNPSPNGAAYTYTAYTDAANTQGCSTAPCLSYIVTFALEDDTGELRDGNDGDTIPSCQATPGGITCL